MTFKLILKKFDQKFLLGFLKKFYVLFQFFKKNYLHKKFLKRIESKTELKNISFLNNYKVNTLSKLCEYYGSDKGYLDFDKSANSLLKPHTYTNIYFNLFDHCKESVNLVFECGIGSINPEISCNMTPEGRPGASLKVWKDFFKNAEIFGADIDKNILFSEERIKTFFVDQLDKSSIQAMWKLIGRKDFDIIIDDGLHTLEAGENFFLESFKFLKSGGIYIIEDVSNEYFEQLFDKLKKFEPEGIILFDKKNFWYGNNLIIVRKK